MRRAMVALVLAALLSSWSCQRSPSETLLFSIATDGEGSVRSVSAAGKDAKVKTLLRGNGLFDWSPVAKQLAFTRDSAHYDEVRSTVLGSSTQRTLSRFDGQWIQELSWSPDGTQLLVSTAPPTPLGDPHTTSTLWVLDVAGNEKRQLYDGPGLGWLSWSADGQSVIGAERSNPPRADRAGRLVVIALDNPKPVASVEGAYFGTWSPDGRHLAVGTRDALRRPLWVRNKDGSGGREVADNIWPLPIWSPDGKRLAFVRTDPKDRAALYTVAPDGSDLRRLVALRSAATCLAWSPDSARIAYVSSGELKVIGANGKGRIAFPQATTPSCPVEWVSGTY